MVCAQTCAILFPPDPFLVTCWVLSPTSTGSRFQTMHPVHHLHCRRWFFANGEFMLFVMPPNTRCVIALVTTWTFSGNSIPDLWKDVFVLVCGGNIMKIEKSCRGKVSFHEISQKLLRNRRVFEKLCNFHTYEQYNSRVTGKSMTIIFQHLSSKTSQTTDRSRGHSEVFAPTLYWRSPQLLIERAKVFIVSGELLLILLQILKNILSKSCWG